jgi:uncharacterized RDD family membrane protein YckC
MSAGRFILRTDEGVTFAQPLAGPVARALAWSVDAAMLLLLSALAAWVVVLLAWLAPGLAAALGSLLFFGLQTGYAMALEWFWRGQTVGKRVVGLRVVDAAGLRLTPAQVVVRNLLRVVDALPAAYLVGGAACVLSRRGQRLGDLAAGTVVVRGPRAAAPDARGVLGGRFNTLRAHPHLAARLRQRVGAAEATAALQALRRRDLLEPAARVALFRAFAEHFRRAVPFPPEAVEGLTDEAYVRAVVDVLFRAREGAPAGAASPGLSPAPDAATLPG